MTALYSVLDTILKDCDEGMLAGYNRFLRKEELGNVFRRIYWKYYTDDLFLTMVEKLFGSGATKGIKENPLEGLQQFTAEDHLDMYNLMDEMIEKWIDSSIDAPITEEAAGEDGEEGHDWAADLLREMNQDNHES